MRELPQVTRVEVIDSNGRTYVCMDASKVRLSIQDDGRTIKIFLDGRDKADPR